jgi:hypothetical protein
MQLTIDLNDYPMLQNMDKTIAIDYAKQIFKIGYNIYFPEYQPTEYNHIVSKIGELQSEIKELNMKDYITTLDQSLNRLIGLASNSNKKGNFAENILETIFDSRYGDIKFERKSGTAHAGDAWLYLPDNTIIILESKNYMTTVNKDEIIKLQNDMIDNNILWGVMCSFNSSIQGMRELDFHTFIHNNNTYSIIMISNLSNNINKLDLGIMIIRKLIKQLDTKVIFPWAVNDINKSLSELNKIINKNYILRSSFSAMEQTIYKSLSQYHEILRDYQYDIEKKINEITNKILSTMEKPTIKTNMSLLDSYKDKKIFPIITRLLDIIQEKQWSVVLNDSIITIHHNDTIVGSVKIQAKKLIFSNDDIIINLNNDDKIIQKLQIIKLL